MEERSAEKVAVHLEGCRQGLGIRENASYLLEPYRRMTQTTLWPWALSGADRVLARDRYAILDLTRRRF